MRLKICVFIAGALQITGNKKKKIGSTLRCFLPDQGSHLCSLMMTLMVTFFFAID
jgi:hypothetical protein